MELKDRYGRHISYVRISVTDRCNLRCTYCMPEDYASFLPKERLLSDGQIVRLTKAFGQMGVRRIRLTGGEPLVRNGLPALIGRIKEQPGIEKVALTTNGLLLAKQMRELYEAGLGSVNISLDTLDEDAFRQITRGGDLKQVLTAIHTALQFDGIMVKVNCVTAPGNEQMYVRLAKMAQTSPLCVRFIEMMPIGLGAGQQILSSDALQTALEAHFGKGEPVEHMYDEGPAVYVRFPDFRGNIGFINAISHGFCDSCNRIRITADGRLKTCLQYEAGIDLHPYLEDERDDRALEEAIARAVWDKPRSHCFASTESSANQAKEDGVCTDKEKKLESRIMSGIGG